MTEQSHTIVDVFGVSGLRLAGPVDGGDMTEEIAQYMASKGCAVDETQLTRALQIEDMKRIGIKVHVLTQDPEFPKVLDEIFNGSAKKIEEHGSRLGQLLFDWSAEISEPASEEGKQVRIEKTNMIGEVLARSGLLAPPTVEGAVA